MANAKDIEFVGKHSDNLLVILDEGSSIPNKKIMKLTKLLSKPYILICSYFKKER